MKRIFRFVLARIMDAARYIADTPTRAMYRGRTRQYIQKYGNRKNRVFLLLTAEYGNLGDHLIAAGSHKFLERLSPGEEVVECSMQHWLHDKRGIRRMIGKGDRLFIAGGGFIGSLWPVNDRMVTQIILSFPENKLVILPQTIYCDSSASGERWLRETPAIYGRHKKLFLFTRDKRSYEFAKEHKLAPLDRCMLAPDMALFFCRRRFFDRFQGEREGAALCMRDDREATDIADEIRRLEGILGKNVSLTNISTQLPSHVLLLKDRRRALEDFLRTVASKRLVITNRLHGMIICLITGTPCIAFDNISGKLSGVYEWIKDSRLIYLADRERAADMGWEQLSRQMEYASRWEEQGYPALQSGFQEMERALKEYLKGD